MYASLFGRDFIRNNACAAHAVRLPVTHHPCLPLDALQNRSCFCPSTSMHVCILACVRERAGGSAHRCMCACVAMLARACVRGRACVRDRACECVCMYAQMIWANMASRMWCDNTEPCDRCFNIQAFHRQTTPFSRTHGHLYASTASQFAAEQASALPLTALRCQPTTMSIYFELQHHQNYSSKQRR